MKVSDESGSTCLEGIEASLFLEGVYRAYGYDFREYAAASMLRRLRAAMANEGVETISALQDRVLYSTITLGFQPLSERREIPNERFGLPFEWLDRLGLETLLSLD